MHHARPASGRPIAIEWGAGHPVITLHWIEGIEFVEATVAALLGTKTDLAIHLFRECWAVGTGSDIDLMSSFGWEPQVHGAKVALAADLVALWHNGRITVDRGPEEVSGSRHFICPAPMAGQTRGYAARRIGELFFRPEGRVQR